MFYSYPYTQLCSHWQFNLNKDFEKRNVSCTVRTVGSFLACSGWQVGELPSEPQLQPYPPPVHFPVGFQGFSLWFWREFCVSSEQWFLQMKNNTGNTPSFLLFRGAGGVLWARFPHLAGSVHPSRESSLLGILLPVSLQHPSHSIVFSP